MNKSVIAWIACSLLIGAALADEHPKEHPQAKPAAAGGAAVLDGKVFVGELVKSGETSGDKDELTFKAGTFVSSACVPHGFREAAYSATEKDGVITFAATATNAKGETMSWTGTIKQGVLEGTAIHKSTSGETAYAFKGRRPEHPEHPKK